MADFPDAGKIQNDFFSEIIFPKLGRERKEVIIGSQYGVDVAVVRLNGGMAMALTSDPLSLIPSLGLRESAWLSVQILANDMATTGFAPMYAQFVLNLPISVNANDFSEYWNYMHHYCKEIGIAITGGHTGQVVGQNSTIAGGGTFITIAQENLLLTSNKAQVGDVIIVTKECALTASSILAMSFPDTIKNKCGVEVYQRACEMFYSTTSLKDGLTASVVENNQRDISAMHDVTEGGVLGAIYEMASASNLGVAIYMNDLPTGVVQENICKVFELDQNYVIGAGSMIIAANADKKEVVLSRLTSENIKASVVGHFINDVSKKELIGNDSIKPLQHSGTDAYWNAFYNAINKGWK